MGENAIFDGYGATPARFFTLEQNLHYNA